MAKLLVVKANPLPTEQSVSLTTAAAFVDSYTATHGADSVTELNLFDMDVPEIDGDTLSAWGALGGGADFASLTPTQQDKLTKRGAILEQFKAHDKVLFVTPLWNFNFPSRVKNYLDCLCVAGETFRYTENGPEGLLTDKKAYHINASGSVFGEYNPADKHLQVVLGFMGITDYTSQMVEGHAKMPDQAEAIKAKGIEVATEAGKNF